MLDNLLNFLVRATSVQPDYSKQHCIAFKQSATVCKVCQEVCPHEAITFRRNKEVVIDDIDCTGCGLCVQHCPSQALESKVNYQRGAPVKCSKVKGRAQTVQCLGRLTPSDLLNLAGTKTNLTLVHNDCANCNIGTAEVPEIMTDVMTSAQDIASLRGRDLELSLVQESHYDATDNPDTISRRELLQGGWRGVQNTAADVLAPLDPGDTDKTALPREMQLQYSAIKMAKPDPETTVPWMLPRVAEGCIMCPVCTNVCPTRAFSRDFHPNDQEGNERGGSLLELEPERCNGCNACVKACPVKVISLDDNVTWAELSAGKQEAYYKGPDEMTLGAVARKPS